MIFKRFLLLLTVLSSFYLGASSQDFMPNGGSSEERINEQMNAAVGASQRPNNPSLFSLVSMSQYNPRAVRNAISIPQLLSLLSLERYQKATPAQVVALSQRHEKIRGILLQDLASQIHQDFAELVQDLNRNRVFAAYFLGIYTVDLLVASDAAWNAARNAARKAAFTPAWDAAFTPAWDAAWDAARKAVLIYIRPICSHFLSLYPNASPVNLALYWLIHHGHEYRLLAFNAALAALPEDFSTEPLPIISDATWNKPELADNPYIKFLKSAMEAMAEHLNKNNFAGEFL